MLARIVAEVHGDDAAVPTLRSLASGGARMPRLVLEQALRVFPHTGFVNAYGLTETASSVAVLGPEDHREAHHRRQRLRRQRRDGRVRADAAPRASHRAPDRRVA